MYRQLIINVTAHETRVGLLEDGTIVELFIRRKDDSDIAGNIYKGRVQRVLPGMQAAFVDIGLKQAAFIHVSDVLEENHSEFEALFGVSKDDETEENQAADPAQEESKPANHRRRKQMLIEDVLTEEQMIMVQVAKSPIGSKGARITSHISLPGHFLVLMPTSDHIGISRRIEDEKERTRLKELVARLRDEYENPNGFIVRTAAEGVVPEKLVHEMGFLKNLWENIQKKYQTATIASSLHYELDVTLRAVRDLLTHEADKVIIDSRQAYKSVLKFLDQFGPGLKDSVEYYEGAEPIFDGFNLEGDILRALKRKVWLKSGGYIVIEHTEALVAIDVNTGRYTGKRNLEETTLKINLEAIKEIAYQLRLRDLGGIIIIDFIDMEKKSNQEKVYNALKETLKRDRSKTHVLPISELGLVQMTRKRIRRPITRILCEPCLYCEGEGYLISRQSICYNIYREITREVQNMMGSQLTVKVNPEIAELLHGEEHHLIATLERRLGKQVNVYPSPRYHMEEFDIFETITE